MIVGIILKIKNKNLIKRYRTDMENNITTFTLNNITTFTLTTTENCDHKTYTYKTIYFWIFKRTFRVCHKCHELIPHNKWQLT